MKTREWTVDELLRYGQDSTDKLSAEIWLRAAFEFIQNPDNDVEERHAVYEAARIIAERL